MNRTTRALRPLTLSIILACAAGYVQAQPYIPAQNAALTRGVVAAERPADREDGQYLSDGAALSIHTPRYTAQRAAPEQMAREYLTARHGVLGLQQEELDTLVTHEVRQGDDFSVVRFNQTAQGLPVYDSWLAVSVTPAGKVIFVSNGTQRGLQSVDTVSRRSGADAMSIARDYLGIAADARILFEDAREVVYRAPTGTHRVWQTTVQAVGLDGAWEVLVDAQTGEILRAEDTNAYADGTAMVFYPDPLSYTRSTYGSAGYVDGSDADTTQLTAARHAVTLRDLTFSGGVHSLVGTYASCLDWAPPSAGDCVTQASSDFNFTRAQDAFEGVNTYYHIDTYMRYVNQTLGITAVPNPSNTAVVFDPHGFSGQDNSSYTPATRRLQFGEGGVDDAEDADVIVHELGHGLHHWLAGVISQTEGLSEGVGDYFAHSYSADFPGQWTPADAQYYWMFSWDGHNPFWAGRVVNWQLNRTYPGNIGSGIHAQGQYWASCNFYARELIGGQAMDRAHARGLSMTTGSGVNQKTAAQAVINAAAAMGYTADQVNQIGFAFNSGNAGGARGCTYGVTVPEVADDTIFESGFE